MKKKVAGTGISVLMASAIALTGCGGSGDSSSSSAAPSTDASASPAASAAASAAPTTAAKKDVKGEITMWAFNEKVFEEVADAFMKEYPNVKVNTVVMPFADLHDKLQTTLAAGTGAPDVAEVEMYQLNRYMTGNVLEDLQQAPYNAGQYKDLVNKFNWERWKTPDGKKLIGMPWDMTPGVYYYRADIFEQLGLPSDPKELGDYMQDPEQFLNLVQKLKANGKYFMEWTDGPAVWAGDEVGYFEGADMKWTRNTDRMAQVLDVVKRGNQIGWAPHIGYGSDEGKQLVKKGDLAGIVAGSFGARELENTFPELSGKWRVTRLPIGINVGMGGSSFVMPSQGKNKDAAWAYIEWSMRSETAWKIWTKYSIQPGYKDIAQKDWYASHKSEYLGGQEDYKFYETLNDSIPTKHLTPIDGKGWEIFIAAIGDALKNNTDSKTVMQKIQDDVLAQAAQDIENFKKALNQ